MARINYLYHRLIRKIKGYEEQMIKQGWEYVVTLIALCVMSLLLFYTLLSNAYKFNSLREEANKNVLQINELIQVLQNTLKTPKAVEGSKSGDKNTLLGSPVVTSSHFTLAGIQYDKSSNNAKALIIEDVGGEGGKTYGIYTIGEKLPKGAVVKAIGANQVILFYNGNVERLTLWDEKQAK